MERTDRARIGGDVAIIGMACMFPGARDLDAYWQNILNKVDAVTDPPPEAWDSDVFYDPDSDANDRVYCKRGGFLGPLAEFNPLDYGIMPAGLDGGEPDQWLALKVAYDALADAGYLERLKENAHERHRTAVILGKGTYLNRGNLNMVQHSLVVDQTLQILQALHPEYSQADLQLLRAELKKRLPPFNAEAAPGLVPNITAGRIANRLDLMGPSYTVDAACASSLIAVEIAMRDLLTDQCDLALVGGVQVTTPIPILTLFCQLGALSRRQEIRPFDKDADGTILSEGLGMIVLKRREDAERDGDRIYAVIKAVGTASDGRATGVLTPRVEGEVLALRRAYEAAGIAPETVDLIEAHGTGTPVGDLAEIQALRAVFGGRGGRLPHVALGSVKSMIGHAMPAAGIAGIIKAALALYHKVLPPTIHCDEPNPRLELEKTPFYINTEVRPWVHGVADTPRRAGVNAFGFGGINAHVILEEAPELQEVVLLGHMRQWESEVVILAAVSRPQLVEKARQLMAYADAAPDVALLDLAYTVNAEIGEQPCRLAVVAESVADLREKLAYAVSRLERPEVRQIKDVRGIYFFEKPFYPEGKLAFLFPGEGSQYPNMLADLCLHFPEVRACFDQIDRIFVDHPRGYLPSDFIFPRLTPPGQESMEPYLWRIDGAIEAVLTANMALFTLLTRLGVRPDAIVGHSTGEYSAMLAAGIIPVSNDGPVARYGSFVSRYLSQLNQMYEERVEDADLPRAVMLAVGAGLDRVASIIEQVSGEVYVGMDNCPHQSVVVGEKSAMEAVVTLMQNQRLIYEVLPFDRAYHTPLFAPYLRLFQEFYDQLPLAAPKTRTYSCVTAAPFSDDTAEIRALATNSWMSRVRFRETIQAMYEDGVRIFVEVGARGNLTAFVGDILRGQPHLAIPANIQQRSGITQLNHLLGLLSAQGVPLNLDELYRRRHPRWLELDPTGQIETRKKPARTVKLATGWAGMAISPEVASRLRHRISEASGGGGNDSPVTDAAEGTATANVVTEADRGRLTETMKPTPAPGAAPTFTLMTQQGTNPMQQDGRTQVMQAHLRLMEQFLQTQEAVMRQFMSRSASVTHAPAIPPQPVSLAASAPVLLSQTPPSAPTEPVLPTAIPAASTPAKVATSAPAPKEATAQSVSVQEILLRLVSEKTGYPEEMLDLSANLEADLGIDSIKRVEILSAFNRRTGLLDPKDMERVSSLKSLGAIISFFTQQSAGTSQPRQMPFIRTVRSHTPGWELDALCPLDLNEDLFLRDHTLGRNVSRLDADLLALPIVPLTISMEIMAEAAAYLLPDEVLVGMRNVRAYRWIMLEEGAVNLQVVARRKPAPYDHEVEVYLREADNGTGAKNQAPIAEGTMVFAASYPAPPPASPLSLRGERPSRWLPLQLYTEGMFHGPVFQAVASVDKWGEDGAVATLRALPTDRFLRSQTAPAFIAEPVILDAAGQLIAFWTQEHLESGFVIFPYQLEALDFYGPALRPLEDVICQARITLIDGGRISSNLDIVDQTGRLRMRLQAWEDKRFDVPRTFYRFTLDPGKARLSEPWTTPLAHFATDGRYWCHRVRGFTEGLFTAHFELWEKVLAHLILNRTERQTWKGMTGPEKRRVEWLLGRVAAKEAVAALVQERYGLTLCPADIEISADEYGRPLVKGEWLRQITDSISISIAHADGTAVAIAGLACANDQRMGIGIDIESVQRQSQEFANVAFSPMEQALLANLKDASQGAWPLRLWCAKEAAGKALGRGLVGGPQGIVVRWVDVNTGLVQMELADKMAQWLPAIDGQEITAYTARDGDWVVASVLGEAMR